MPIPAQRVTETNGTFMTGGFVLATLGVCIFAPAMSSDLMTKFMTYWGHFAMLYVLTQAWPLLDPSQYRGAAISKKDTFSSWAAVAIMAVLGCYVVASYIAGVPQMYYAVVIWAVSQMATINDVIMLRIGKKISNMP